MQALEPPDTHLVSAAVGWIELGNFPEAKLELEKLSPNAAENPDVLEIWWLIHAEEKNWSAGLETAGAMLEADPGRSSGWLHRAYALRRTRGGGLQAAWDALRPAFDKFPKEPVVSYNLSCYACQMDRLAEARMWLNAAVEAGGKEKIKAMALHDADLKPLWDEIREL